jgi:hypothetical protein
VHRTYLIVVPQPVLRQFLASGEEHSADACCASHARDRDAQAVARGAVPCASQVPGLGTESAARGAACCASHVRDRGAQAGDKNVWRLVHTL